MTPSIRKLSFSIQFGWLSNEDFADFSGGPLGPTYSDQAPDRLHDAKGPRATREAVGTGECAPEGEQYDESSTPAFEGVLAIMNVSATTP